MIETINVKELAEHLAMMELNNLASIRLQESTGNVPTADELFVELYEEQESRTEEEPYKIALKPDYQQMLSDLKDDYTLVILDFKE